MRINNVLFSKQMTVRIFVILKNECLAAINIDIRGQYFENVLVILSAGKSRVVNSLGKKKYSEKPDQ